MRRGNSVFQISYVTKICPSLAVGSLLLLVKFSHVKLMSS